MSYIRGHYPSGGAQPPDGRSRQRGPHGSAPRTAHRTGARRHLRRLLGLDRSPLCRPVDRLRSAVVLTTSLLLAASVAVAWAVASLILHSELTAAAQQRAHRHLVSAVTVSAPVAGSGYGSAAGTSEARATWSYAGRSHTAWIDVPGGTRDGSTVSTWVDDSGQPSIAPRSDSAAAADAALAGVGTAVAAAGAVVLASGAVLHLVDRRTGRAWEDEWSRIEPGWSGRAGWRHPNGTG